MAEMTAEQAKIFIAQELKALSGPEGCCIQSMQRNQAKRNNLRGLAALIEQQAAEIATSEQKYKNWIGPIEHRSLLDEIAKNDRMLNVVIGKLFILPDRDECPDDVPCLPRVNEKRDHDIGDCRTCWFAWLEKEARGGGVG